MVTEALTANDLVNLGRCMCALINADIWSAKDYTTSRDMFLELAKKCNFQATYSAARCLQPIIITKNPGGNNVEINLARRLKDMCEGANFALVDEASKTTVILTDVQPPIALTNLQATINRPLEPHQTALQQDLIICLRSHLARPAIVMAWALGYDLVRSWIFRDPQRQAALATQLKEPLNGDYDFFHLNEYRVLAGCRNSQDPALASFTDSELRDLQSLLDQRNDFAHANYNRASINKATAYVERLVRILISPPFI